MTRLVPVIAPVPLKFTVPPLHPTVPSPLIQELAPRVWVPPLKFRVAVPVAALVPLLLPPPCKLNVPLSASTVPVLLKESLMTEVPVPPVLWNSPVL